MPALIDPIRLADTGKRLTGSLEVKVMRRLAAACLTDNGSVSVDLMFERSGGSGLRHMHGSISTVLTVTCQRCLEGFPLELNVHPRMMLFRAGEERDLPSEESDFLIVDKSLSLSELIEDELLMAMPMFPMHGEDICPAARRRVTDDDAAKQGKENPFSVLRTLKQTDKKVD